MNRALYSVDEVWSSSVSFPCVSCFSFGLLSFVDRYHENTRCFSRCDHLFWWTFINQQKILFLVHSQPTLQTQYTILNSCEVEWKVTHSVLQISISIMWVILNPWLSYTMHLEFGIVLIYAIVPTFSSKRKFPSWWNSEYTLQLWVISQSYSKTSRTAQSCTSLESF